MTDVFRIEHLDVVIGSVNDRVLAVLAAHLGIISRRQLRECGCTDRQVEWAVETGELVRVHHGVYRHAAVPVTYEQRIVAGLVAAGPGSAASHRTGLVVHGARNFSSALVEVVGARPRRPSEGLLVHRSVSLIPRDIVNRQFGHVTTPARSLVDSAMVMSPVVVARIAQDWLANRVVDLDDVHAVLDRVGRRHSAAAFRRALEAVDLGAADSVPEKRLGEILAAAGIPPTLHHVVTTDLGETYEIDWAYPEQRVALELDGYGIHLRSFDAFEQDRYRRNEIVITGWDVLNFTSRMVRRRPHVVIDQVRRKLTARNPH